MDRLIVNEKHTELDKVVIKIINDKIEGNHSEKYPYDFEAFDNDMQNGCVTGFIGELIYYTDTVAFFEKHKEEINELLTEQLDNTDLSIDELFGDKWDNSDPLLMEDQNKNLLAWFAFEETACQLKDAWDSDGPIRSGSLEGRSDDCATSPNYWDCECESHFINRKTDRLKCEKCGTAADDMPDSRINEIGLPNTMAETN